MKNSIRAQKKALPKTTKKQTETPDVQRQLRNVLLAAPWIEPITPGRYRPRLNESQACAVIALAIHNARPDLERLGATMAQNGRAFQAGSLAQTLTIAAAVVRFQVLQCLEVEDRPTVPQIAIPGLCGIPPLSVEEALLEMVATIHRDAWAIIENPCHSATAQAELLEAIMIAEEILDRRRIGTDREHGKGTDWSKPTDIQVKAWEAKIRAQYSAHYQWAAA